MRNPNWTGEISSPVIEDDRRSVLAGILLLAWSIVQFLHRNLPVGLLQGASDSLTEPPCACDESAVSDEEKMMSSLLQTGPPQLSLQLQATETSMDPTVRLAVADSALGDVLGLQEEKSATVEENALPDLAVLQDPEEILQAAAEASALATDPELVPVEVGSQMVSDGTNGTAMNLENEKQTPQSGAAAIAPIEETAGATDASLGQAQPIPQLTAAPFAEPALSEMTQPNPETGNPISPAIPATETMAGWDAAQSAAEPPSFLSKVITAEPTSVQSTTPIIMQETTITPAPVFHPFSPTMPVQRPAGAMRTAVQLTFSLEIGSMQLTPTFKMRDLRLKPTSRVVTVRLAPCQVPHAPIDLQITFEIAKIELEGESIRTIRLLPSEQQKPAVVSSSSFAVAGLELEPNSGIATVQLTPSHQAGASVHLTAAFQIAAIEFSPCFGIAAIVLNPTSRNVSLQLPGAEPNSIEDPPVFSIEKVEMNGSQLGLIQVAQLGSGHL